MRKNIVELWWLPQVVHAVQVKSSGGDGVLGLVCHAFGSLGSNVAVVLVVFLGHVDGEVRSGK